MRTWGVGGRRALLAVQYSLRTSHITERFFCECFQRRCFLFYQEAIDYIKNIERSGSDYGIERMRELLDLLGAPDRHLKFVHIAGTNGKGSVSAYLTSVLKEAGYKVGTYNSPSVFCYNERWLINGNPLSNEDVAKYLTAVRECIESEQILRNAFGISEFKPTAFEIETAVAMLAFFDKECDVCVLETGLGGRWDATNAIEDKVLSIITPICLDHCALLGNTLGEIASEKAAIIKDEVVTCNQPPEVMEQLKRPFALKDGKKEYRKANVVVCKEPKFLRGNLDGQVFSYDGKEYEISMLGKHQLVNAAIAICAVEELNKKHFDISENALKVGLKNTIWKARLQVVKNAKEEFNITIPQDKVLVFDGSHNPQGATTLANAIKDLFKNKRVHLVLGILKDKDVKGICTILAPLANRITCITPPSPRAMQKEELKCIVAPLCKGECSMQDDIKTAVQNALNGDCDVTILCGSLTLFSDLKSNE